MSLDMFLKVRDWRTEQAFELVVYVFTALVLAVRDLHERGYGHGNICPENILLTEKCYPVLTGFGSAVFVKKESPGEKLKQGQRE